MSSEADRWLGRRGVELYWGILFEHSLGELSLQISWHKYIYIYIYMRSRGLWRCTLPRNALKHYLCCLWRHDGAGCYPKCCAIWIFGFCWLVVVNQWIIWFLDGFIWFLLAPGYVYIICITIANTNKPMISVSQVLKSYGSLNISWLGLKNYDFH